MGGTRVKFQCSRVAQGYLGQSATGSDSRRTPRIAWLIADTDPLGTHNGIAWLTGANNMVGVSHGDRETPVTCHRSHHMGASACLWGRGRGPRTRDTRSTRLSASVLPAAAESWVDLGGSGYLGPSST